MLDHQKHIFTTLLNQAICCLIFFALMIIFIPQIARAFCHETELVGDWPFRIIPAATRSSSITIEWLGHSAFRLTSSHGTKVLMDPHGREGTPAAGIPSHVVTTSHLHGNHSFIWMASGDPILLHGLNLRDGDWNRIHKTIRDVSFFTVPTYHDSQLGLARGKNAVFVVSMDEICVAHLGDLGHLFNENQIKMLGKIDVLFVPLGQGGFRITAEDAVKIVGQVKPKIVIPYHYRWEGYVEEFAQTFKRVRKVKGNRVRLSKDNLKKNAELEIIVLQDTMMEDQ